MVTVLANRRKQRNLFVCPEEKWKNKYRLLFKLFALFYRVVFSVFVIDHDFCVRNFPIRVKIAYEYV